MSDAPECSEFKIAIKNFVSRIHLGRVIWISCSQYRSISLRLIKWEASFAVRKADINVNGGAISNITI